MAAVENTNVMRIKDEKQYEVLEGYAKDMINKHEKQRMRWREKQRMKEMDTILKYCKKHPPASFRTSDWWKEAAESLEMDKGKIHKCWSKHVKVQKQRKTQALKDIDDCKAKTVSLTEAAAKLTNAKAKLKMEWKAANAKAANAKAKLKNAKAELKEVNAKAKFAKAEESPVVAVSCKQ